MNSPRICTKTIKSFYFDNRPIDTIIDTIIIHSMYNPNDNDHLSAQSCKKCLDIHKVSAHYLIDIHGDIWKLVDEKKRAWHAGESKMPNPGDGRIQVNNFSIGIEMIGKEDTGFSKKQYTSLVSLIKDILSRHLIKNILGHSDIAPNRKTDPWCFDWEFLKQKLSEYRIEIGN